VVIKKHSIREEKNRGVSLVSSLLSLKLDASFLNKFIHDKSSFFLLENYYISGNAFLRGQLNQSPPPIVYLK
jgi:hypothetical protein